jgi:hypothetical protein
LRADPSPTAEEVWGPAHVEDSHYVRVYMGHLRKKIEDNPSRPKHILTEAGVGYLRNNRLRSMSYQGAVHSPLICVVFCLLGFSMGAESKFRLVDVWVGVRDPRQTTKVEHDLIELLVVSVSAVLSGPTPLSKSRPGRTRSWGGCGSI